MKLSEAIGKTLTTAGYVDNCDYINLPPKIGYDPGYNEAPVASDFKYALSAAGTNSFVFRDKSGKEIVYFTSITPYRLTSVFRGYRYNANTAYAVDNDPISLTFLGNDERLCNFINVGTYFIIAQTESISYPKTKKRVLVIKTGGSSISTDWTLAYDITSISSASVSNFSLQTINNVDYLLMITGDLDVQLRVYNPSTLALLRSVQLAHFSNDVHYSDQTGSGRTGGSFIARYLAYGRLPGFTWNPFDETLRLKVCCFNSIKLGNGNSIDYGRSFNITTKVPAAWISNGSGAPTSLIAVKSTGKRYNFYSDSGDNAPDSGQVSGDFGVSDSILTDEYTGDTYLCRMGTWEYTSMYGTCYIYRYKQGNPLISYGHNHATHDRAVYGAARLPDGSVYGKNIQSTTALVINDYIYFVGHSTRYGDSHMLAKFFTDRFDTVNATNDTMIIDASTINTSPLEDLPEELKGQGFGGHFCTTVLNGAPVYSIVKQNKYIYKITIANNKFVFTKVNKIVPKVPTTVPGTGAPVQSVGVITWNGDENNPVYYVPVKTNTYVTLLKYSGGTWSVLANNLAKAHIDNGNRSRGDTSYEARISAKSALLTQNGRMFVHTTVRFVGDTTTAISVVNVNTGAVEEIDSNRWLPVNANTNAPAYAWANSVQENATTLSFSTLFGYTAFKSPLDLTSMRLISSKRPLSSNVLTEDEWYTGSKVRNETVVSTASSIGLIAYITEYPVFLGGYFTVIPNTQVSLKPNTVNYIYASKTATDRSTVVIFTNTERLTDSFSQICIAKITTGSDRILNSYLYSVDGLGLPSQEGKEGKCLYTNGKNVYWG